MLGQVTRPASCHSMTAEIFASLRVEHGGGMLESLSHLFETTELMVRGSRSLLLGPDHPRR